MKKLIFLMLSVIMTINLLTVSFADDTETALVGSYRPIIDMGIVELDEVTEYTEPAVMALSLSADWVDNGSKNFYNYLATQENGEKLQGFYNLLYRSFKRYIYDANGKTTTITATDSDGNSVTARYLCINATDYYNTIGWSNMINVYNAVIQDNPQFFFTDLLNIGVSSSGSIYFGTQIADEYLNSDSRIDEADAITAGVDRFDQIIDMNMSNYIIEKKVHDKLILDNNYALDENGNPVEKRYAHSIAGSLNSKYGGGVCESYAKAFQLLLNRYNVPCYFIAGYANGGGHAWNCAQLDNGKYYCVDTTWDDPVSSSGKHYLKYTYFNMPVSDFYSNRNTELTYYNGALPDCADDKNYYTADAKKVVGEAENGDELYLAPVVLESETRTEAPSAETTTEATTVSSYEYSTEATTTDLQLIASNSIKKDFVVSAQNCKCRKFSNEDTYFAYTGDEYGEVYIILDEACMLQFNLQFNENYSNDNVILYIDDQPVYSYNATSTYKINTPQGQHKISWVLSSQTGEYVILTKIIAVAKGDYNLNGKVDLTDAVGLINDGNLSLSLYDYVDANNDGSVNVEDIAYILKHCSGII